MKKHLLLLIVLSMLCLSGCISICNGKEISYPNPAMWSYFYILSTATVTCNLCLQSTTYANHYEIYKGTGPIRGYDGTVITDCPDGWVIQNKVYWHKECWDEFFNWLKNEFKSNKDRKSWWDSNPNPMLPNGGNLYFDQFGRLVSKEEFDKIGKTEVVK